jgi:hypothetical protein
MRRNRLFQYLNEILGGAKRVLTTSLNDHAGKSSGMALFAIMIEKIRELGFGHLCQKL